MTSKEQAHALIKRVDYMNIYTSDLVKAVRKAAGNTGITHENISLKLKYV